MAQVIERNERNKFKVIKVSAAELCRAIGSPGICDYCGKPHEEGYYIAVLNSWYCPNCYERFIKCRKWHIEDANIEDRNFKYYSKLLGV